MASIHATTSEGEQRTKLVVVQAPGPSAGPGILRRLGAGLLDRATVALSRSRQRADLGALYATAETGRETGARC
jgi:hypothetical protein